MSTPDTPQAPPQQPPAGQIFVLNPSELSPREIANLRAAGKNPDEHCLILASPLQMQAIVQQDQSGQHVIVLQIVAAVPHSVLPLPLRGIMDANGNTPAGSKAKDAIPLPPDVRIVVQRAALAEHVRNELDRARLLHTLQMPAGGAQS